MIPKHNGLPKPDEPIIKILPTDRYFSDSPDAGTPECICSRCGELIEEWDCPIRAWPERKQVEFRFHPKCIGAIGVDEHETKTSD